MKRWIAGMILMALAGAGCGGESSNGFRGTSNDVHEAWVNMQILVKERLKAPGSAEFPSGDDLYVTPVGDKRYKVNSFVDSENAFGGSTRLHFEGVIEEIEGSWQLDYLYFEE